MEAVTPREDHEFLASVRSYYDRTTELYLRHLGTTLQAGVLSWRHGASGATQFPKHNLFFAERAGIRRGARILDAGCGVCGPSIDIASGIDDVCFDCVTISPVQASIAKQNVDHRGLRSRVRVQVGDYHHLPFQDDFFDTAVFFESACYSYDQGALFQEVRRVLTPAGRLYVKDVFVEDGVLSAAQAEELDQTAALALEIRDQLLVIDHQDLERQHLQPMGDQPLDLQRPDPTVCQIVSVKVPLAEMVEIAG